jgi:hypothetical protein
MHIGIVSSTTCSAVNVIQNVFSTPNPVIDEAIVIRIMLRPQKSPTLRHISHEIIFTTSFKNEFVVQMIYGIPPFHIWIQINVSLNKSLEYCMFTTDLFVRPIAIKEREGPSWPWSYDSWMYNYLCNQCLWPLMLWVLISISPRCTTSCNKVCQWLATGRWFSPGPPVSSTHETDRHDITEILLKVALSTIK